MATVHLPRSLVALFPGVPRRLELAADDVDGLFRALDAEVPGMRDRLVTAGPTLREHLNVFVDGQPADLETPLTTASVVHVIPAVSGGGRPARGPVSLRTGRRRPSAR